MTSSTRRYEHMLFDYGTTMRTDYRGGKFPKTVHTEYKARPERPRQPYEPAKYVHTLNKWKKCLPFSETIKLREILQTNPQDVQKPYDAHVDNGREEVRRTRPRLVMTPAVSLDDIDPGPRSILIRHCYTSETARSSKEAVPQVFNVKSPLPDHPAPANPIFLPRLKPPYVPKEWRMESVGWDKRQLRSYVEPTKEFWLMPENAPTS